jgi:putative addiction module component (TIGR02574 family)
VCRSKQASELLQKALSLSEEERAELAGSLIESLDATVDESAEAAWNQEIARRIEDLDCGEAKTVPWKEVRSRISSKLRVRNMLDGRYDEVKSRVKPIDGEAFFESLRQREDELLKQRSAK